MLGAVIAPTCEARHRINDLGIQVETYRLAGGATHIHLANDDAHRAFAIGFRTPPEDDCGAPHILEHTVLCGSRAFPVRDPFFAMLRRSLATYLNAITWPDLTCYPFATQIERDFDHMLAVYLDAVFAPLLDPLDFAQEGHRLVTGSAPQRQGVVFNEMKGAFSTSADFLALALGRNFLRDTAQAYESGGLPSAIPHLTHARLVDLHRRWYVPANACIATYGRIDLAALHARLTPYLGTPGRAQPAPCMQTPAAAPRRVPVPVPCTADDQPDDIGCWTRVWHVGDSHDLDRVMDLSLLDELLLGHAGSPLRKALEGSGLGRSIGNSGLDASQRTLLFRVELDGVDPANYPAVERLVARCLDQVADRGFSSAARNAALHQAELAQRDREDDGDPFGVAICIRVLQCWNQQIDAAHALDDGPRLATLRARWADPEYGRALLRSLIDNPAHIDLVADPDLDLRARNARDEAIACTADLARSDLARLEHERAALHARQTTATDFTCLPTLGIGDIPSRRIWPQSQHQAPWVFVPTTNGLITRQVVIDAACIPAPDLDLLPLLASCLGALGVGRRSYAQQASFASRRCVGVTGWFDAEACPGDPQRGTLLLGLETRGLSRNRTVIADLLDEVLDRQRFDELPRLRELIDEELQGLRDDVADEGNRFAAWAARRRLGGAAAWAHRLEGLGRLAWLRNLAETDDDALATRLAALHARLRTAPRTYAEIGDGARADRAGGTLTRATAVPAPTAEPGPDTIYLISASVAHQARVVPTVPLTHADAAALAVGAEILGQRFLLPRLREQGGAYGASASANGPCATFALTSYRDPRAMATQQDFAAAAAWLCDLHYDAEILREGILATIARIDAPQGPVAEASARFLADLRGDGPDVIDPFRQRVLACDGDAVRAAAERWLTGSTVARVCIGPESHATDFPDWAQERP